MMRFISTACSFLLVMSCLAFLGAGPNPPAQKASKPNKAQIERGKYLVTICLCNDCHTPKVFTKDGPALDTSRLLSGHAANDTLPAVPPGMLAPDKWGAMSDNQLTGWAGPWGKSFARNLTPDMNTGIGSWTEDIFIKALRTGKDMGEGRNILPPMPWELIGKMTDSDLKAVFAYLKSLPPIDNAVPDPISPTGERMPTKH